MHLLLDAGANVQARNVNKQSPMHYAARAGDLPLIKLLHKHGADLNLSDRTRRTVLHEAAAAGHKQVVEFLCVRMAPRCRKQVDCRNPYLTPV